MWSLQNDLAVQVQIHTTQSSWTYQQQWYEVDRRILHKTEKL